MLDAWNIQYSYPKTAAPLLDGVSFHVRPGENVGISGPSGCGKSTFAKILAGYLAPTGGRVTLSGSPLQEKGRSPIQLLFQHPELTMNPRWRIRTILEEGGEALPELMEGLKIRKEWMERFPHELSGGELQRVAIVRAVTKETRFLIADEMSAMLDAVTQATLWHAIMAIQAQNGMGMVIISHNRGLLEKLCGRIVSFPQGNEITECILRNHRTAFPMNINW